MPSSQQATLFQKTSRRSDALYDSRAAHEGIGFPSFCTALVSAPRNTADPHDYYAELGVDPAATESEIRAAARQLYRDLHPDTGEHPDPERLTRIHNIVEVLSDPAERIKYNNTPSGHRLNDKVFREEASRLDPDTQRAIRTHIDHRRTAGTVAGRFDYFGVGHHGTDSLLAQQWYHHLMTYAHRSPHQGRVRLLLWDNIRPAWDLTREVLMVPRHWEPSAFTAEVLVAKVIAGEDNPNISDTARLASHMSGR